MPNASLSNQLSIIPAPLRYMLNACSSSFNKKLLREVSEVVVVGHTSFSHERSTALTEMWLENLSGSYLDAILNP